MVFFVVDSSTGDLAHTGSATRGHFRPTRPLSQLLKHALVPDHPTGRTPAGGHARNAAVEWLRRASVFLFPTSR